MRRHDRLRGARLWARSMLENQKHGVLQERFLRIVIEVRHSHVETEYPLGHRVPHRETGCRGSWGRICVAPGPRYLANPELYDVNMHTDDLPMVTPGEATTNNVRGLLQISPSAI